MEFIDDEEKVAMCFIFVFKNNLVVKLEEVIGMQVINEFKLNVIFVYNFFGFFIGECILNDFYKGEIFNIKRSCQIFLCQSCKVIQILFICGLEGFFMGK